MTPFQASYLCFSLAVFALAWLKGGHTERLGVVVTIVAYLSAYAVSPLRVGELRLGEAATDVLATLAFAWMALSRDRWWPFPATAFMVLTMIVHVCVALIPQLGGRADVSARYGLGVLVIVSLLGGVAERWLAGEQPVSRRRPWRPLAQAM